MDDAAYDALDDALVERLRGRGSLKWTRYPEALGAWVAESDLGTAPAVTRALRDAVDRGLFGYLPDWLADDMARATAGFLADRHGWTVPPERVRPLPDVLAALSAAITHLTPDLKRLLEVLQRCPGQPKAVVDCTDSSGSHRLPSLMARRSLNILGLLEVLDRQIIPTQPEVCCTSKGMQLICIHDCHWPSAGF